jgi:DNA polymerase elongation subunit (family B)
MVIFKGMYQIEYATINNEPLIYAFCREDNKKKIHTIRGFKPYFYIKEEEPIPKEAAELITNIEGGYTSIYGDKLKKITVRIPNDVYNTREMFKQTYEADIPFPIRFLIDRVESIIPQKYRVLIIDIETTTTYGFPKEDNSIENITVVSYHDNYTNEITTLVYRPNLPEERIQKEDGVIEYFDDEPKMLSHLIGLIRRIDPDIITAWNVKFDIGYLVARMKALYVDYKALSPMRYVEKRNVDWTIKGRVVFDLLTAYRRIHLSELTSYALASVAKDELGDETEKERIPDFTKVWKEDLNKLIEYNRNDIMLVKRINDRLNIIEQYDQMRLTATADNINSCFFYSRLIDILTLRKYNGKKVFPTKPIYRVRTEEEKVKGGFVLDTKKGLWEDVIVLDMKSLYPSIIQTFNLSKEMITTNEENVINVNGIKINKTNTGILPSIINDLNDLRNIYRSQLKNYHPDSSEYKILFQKSFSIKFFVNSSYGINALPSYRMYDERIANTITFVGREIVQMNMKIAEEQGHIVVAADTDSVILKVKEGTDPIQVGNELMKIINTKLNDYVKQYGLTKHYMKIEFEKHYKKFLAGAKKRYAGYVVWKDGQQTDQMEFAGYEVRRSDNSKVAKQIQRQIMTMILRDGKTRQEVFNYIEQEINKIRNLDYTYDQIALPTKLEKNIDEYEANLPQCRAAKWANKNINTEYSAGSKFMLLYVEDPTTDVIAFDNLYQLARYKVNLDMMKTLDVNIFMKIKKIMEVLGWKRYLDTLWDKYMLAEKHQTTLSRFVEVE